MQEAKELATDTSTDYTAAPLEDDLFVSWSTSLLSASDAEVQLRNGIAQSVVLRRLNLKAVYITSEYYYPLNTPSALLRS